MKYLNKIIFMFVFTSLLVACGANAPGRDYTVDLWKPVPLENEFKHFDEFSGETWYLKMEKLNPKIHVLISIEDYNKERDYQDLLINQCAEWR